MIRKRLTDFENILNLLIDDASITEKINLAVSKITKSCMAGNKILFCGNGGSAAEAQHLAAELSGKFYLDRKPIPAEACHVNSSFMTAVSNDYDFTKTYARYVEAVGKEGDILIGLSTSGNSENILNAFKTAKSKKIYTISLTGHSGGILKELSDISIQIPSEDVSRIQEAHLIIGHIICEIVEKNLFETT